MVVWSGDPLEPLSQPSAVFVNGVEQPLEARNLLLRDRYRQQTPMPPAYRNCRPEGAGLRSRPFSLRRGCAKPLS